jgi:hypothetical protein
MKKFIRKSLLYIQEIIMRKILSLALLLTIVSMFLSQNCSAWSFPLDTVPVEIRFNHGGSNDALNLKVNSSTYVAVPEYVASPYRNNKFAYVKGSTPDVKVKFWGSQVDTPSLTIDVVAATGSSYWGLQSKAVFFNGSGYSITDPSSNPTNYITFTTASGTSVSSSVQVAASITWNWRVVAVGGVPRSPFSLGNTTHAYYTTYSTPVSPMDEPWTGVLDYTCAWASGATSESSIATAIVHGIYNNLGDQDGDIDYTFGTGNMGDYTSGYNAFYLTDFLNALSSSNSVYVNCTDCANLFSIFSRALGCDAKMKTLSRSQADSLLHTKSIDPIGTPGWNPIPNWKYHQIGWLNNLVDDAAARVNQSSPIEPSNMSTSTYINYLLDPNTQSYSLSGLIIPSIYP